MSKIYEYVGQGAYVQGVPARNILQDEWDALPEDARAIAEASGLYKKASGDAVALNPESEPVEPIAEIEMEEIDDEPEPKLKTRGKRKK